MQRGLEIGFDYATDGTMSAGGRQIDVIDIPAPTSYGNSLIESQGIEILVGGSTAESARAIQRIAEQHDLVYFVAPAAAPDITGASFTRQTFRVCHNSAQDALIIDYALESIGDEFLILAEDEASSRTTAAVFESAFRERGARLLADPMLVPGNTVDFAPHLQRVRELAPDGLVLVWTTTTSSWHALIRQLDGDGAIAEIPYIPSFSLFAQTSGLTYRSGSVGSIPYHYSLPDTEVNVFLTEQYVERYQFLPDLFQECGFATAQAVVAALERTEGVTATEALVPALEGLSFEGPKGTYTIRSEDHQALAPMYVVRLAYDDLPYFDLIEVVDAATAAPPCLAETCN